MKNNHFSCFKIKTIGFFAFSLLFMGCSWMTHFYIANHTDDEVVVEIRLSEEELRFPIFYYAQHYYHTYQLVDMNKKGRILHETKEALEVDTLDGFGHCKITIPPGKALEFGVLNNDYYEHYQQDFINDRKFNLISLSFSNGRAPIKPENFDDAITKKDGSVFVLVE